MHRPQPSVPTRLGNRFGVVVVVLLTAPIALHVLRRQQLHLVSQSRQLARPIMTAAAGLHRHPARLEAGEVGQHPLTAQPLASPRSEERRVGAGRRAARSTTTARTTAGTADWT